LRVTTTNQNPYAIMINNATFGTTDGKGFSFFQRNSGTAGISNNTVEALDITSSGLVGIGNTAPGALLDLGLAGTTTGTMRLEGKTSGYVQLQPSAAAGSWTMTLPTSAGTSGYLLQTDGTGVTSWVGTDTAQTRPQPPSNRWSSVPVSRSHSWSIPFSEPDSARRPSARIATAVTASPCASNR
jgi:hypothetical protein